MPNLPADRLIEAMGSAGARRYGGEPVSELEHALQCAELAVEGGADDELVLACLLHDVGRYAVDQSLIFDTLERGAPKPSAMPARRRGHAEIGADLIAGSVPERVAWCVAQHAAAKRYLCAIEPAYYDTLSRGSRHTLTLQGGIMSPADVAAFVANRWSADAVALRRGDDAAKVVDKPTRPLSAWRPLIARYFGR
jgi:predicted HD phosphohydrolase